MAWRKVFRKIEKEIKKTALNCSNYNYITFEVRTADGQPGSPTFLLKFYSALPKSRSRQNKWDIPNKAPNLAYLSF